MNLFIRADEPDEFDSRVRQPGQEWLASHDLKDRPRSYWSEWTECRFHLSNEFRHLCGYSLTYEPVGTVDHFVSCNADRDLAYEWSNYRYASGWINSSKQDQEGILDPFEVEDDWFEILLPSLQMKLADDLENRLPPEQYLKAKNTLTRLHLVNDPRAREPRRVWYQMYLEGKITLAGLEDFAPILARAIRQAQE